MAQFTPQEFLATYLAQNNIPALSPREQYIVLGRLQQVLDASAATGTEPTPQRLAVALAGSKTIRDQTGINDSQSESLIAALIVSADDTVTYIEENGSVEPPVDPVDPDTPADFTLTKADSKENLIGTTKSEVFDATELGSLQDGDIITDASTADNDVLNALVSNANTKARLTNIETINITGEYNATGFDLVNTRGTKVINLDAKLPGATATIKSASTDTVGKIVVKGSNIKTLDVTSFASGTRDTVEVDAGNATTVNLTGMGGADSYNVKLGAQDVSVNLTTYATPGDNLTLAFAGGKKNKLVTGTTSNKELALTINATDDVVLDVTNGTKLLAKTVTVTGNKAVVLETETGASLVGSGTAGSGNESIVGNGNTTIRVTKTADSTLDFQSADVDVIELGKTGKVNGGGTGTTLTINENALLRLAGNMNSKALTVNVDNGAAVSTDKLPAGTASIDAIGILRVELAENNAAASSELKTGDKVNALLLNVKSNEDSDRDRDNNGEKESHLKLSKLTGNEYTKTIILTGDEKLEVGTLTVGDKAGTYAVSAGDLNGNLHIGSLVATAAAEVSVVGAKGDTNITLATGIFDVTLGGTSSTINLNAAKTGTKVTATGGTNTITSTGSEKFTITLGDGNDTVTVAKNDTVNLGAGNNTVKLTAAGTAAAGTVIKDFVKGTDVLELSGSSAAAGTINLGAVKYETATGLKVGSGGTAWNIKLENNGVALSDTNMADSIRLNITGVGGAASSAQKVTAGALNDTIAVTTKKFAEIATGAGKDTVVVALGGASSGNTTTVTVTDFELGVDKIVLTGALTKATGTIDLKNISQTGGVYTLGGASNKAALTLKNGANNIYELLEVDTDLTTVVQLGKDASNYFKVTTSGSAATVVGGIYNDYIELAGATASKAATYQFSKNGGVDTIKMNDASGKDLLDFSKLGIDASLTISATSSGSITSTAVTSYVDDAINKGLYLFESSKSGVDGAKITTFVQHAANGYDQATINAEVAAFITKGLGVSAGEKYVVVINDDSTTAYKTAGTGYGFNPAAPTAPAHNAYIYYVEASGNSLTADDITLIGHIDNKDATLEMFHLG